MKTRAVVTWREGRPWLLALCLALLVGACAQTTTNPGSGETHFVMCDIDEDCDALGSGFSCVAGECHADSDQHAMAGSGGIPMTQPGGNSGSPKYR